jgi:hypothetical protein
VRGLVAFDIRRVTVCLVRAAGGKGLMRSEAQQPLSGAEQFKADVPEARAVRQDWRGGLERSGARRGRAGRQIN